MLDIIKKRCYIVSNIYDDEIHSLINACMQDCISCGVSKASFDKNQNLMYDDLVITAIVSYVKAMRGNDRTDTAVYLGIYQSIRDKMTQDSTYMVSSNE